jgi:hypothetical protein
MKTNYYQDIRDFHYGYLSFLIYSRLKVLDLKVNEKREIFITNKITSFLSKKTDFEIKVVWDFVNYVIGKVKEIKGDQE